MSAARNDRQAHQQDQVQFDQAAAARQQLLGAMVAHELREPANAIQLFARVMLQERVGPLTDEQRDFLSTIQQAAHRLGRLINDAEVMLDVDHNFTIVRETFDLAERLDMCCRELAPRAAQFDVGLSAETTPPGSVFINADPMRVDQILLNLIENAMRYASTGTDVRIRLRHTTTRVLCVVENAVDVPPAEDPREWFEPFRRGSGDAITGRPGLGLGLAVVGHLVREHGGRVLTRSRGQTVAIGFVLPVRFRRLDVRIAA